MTAAGDQCTERYRQRYARRMRSAWFRTRHDDAGLLAPVQASRWRHLSSLYSQARWADRGEQGLRRVAQTPPAFSTGLRPASQKLMLKHDHAGWRCPDARKPPPGATASGSPTSRDTHQRRFERQSRDQSARTRELISSRQRLTGCWSGLPGTWQHLQRCPSYLPDLLPSLPGRLRRWSGGTAGP